MDGTPFTDYGNIEILDRPRRFDTITGATIGQRRVRRKAA